MIDQVRDAFRVQLGIPWATDAEIDGLLADRAVLVAYIDGDEQIRYRVDFRSDEGGDAF